MGKKSVDFSTPKELRDAVKAIGNFYVSEDSPPLGMMILIKKLDDGTYSVGYFGGFDPNALLSFKQPGEDLPGTLYAQRAELEKFLRDEFQKHGLLGKDKNEELISSIMNHLGAVKDGAVSLEYSLAPYNGIGGEKFEVQFHGTAFYRKETDGENYCAQMYVVGQYKRDGAPSEKGEKSCRRTFVMR